MQAEHRDFLKQAVEFACERSLFFTEIQIERLEAQVRQLEMRKARYSKADYAVRSALTKLKGHLKFGDPKQIEAARFLESTGLKFELDDFLRSEDRQRLNADRSASGPILEGSELLP